MVMNRYIQNLIRQKAGLKLNMSSQFEQLSDSILEVTGQKLGVNTLKRLFGKLADVKTSETTLNIMAEYLGYNDWEALEKISEDGNSSINHQGGTVHPKELNEGQPLTLTYEPHRELKLTIRNDKRCLVVSTTGGKLRKGDILDIAEIIIGFPLYVQMVERDGVCLGSYKGGIEGGVIKIELEELTQ